MTKKKWFKAVIIIAIILIPVLYSGFYLKAFWDPYGNLEELPVAIVNLDEGENEENLGKELVDKLLDKGIVKFSVISEQEANDGLVNKEYYAVITIPANFTKKLNSAENQDRQSAVTVSYTHLRAHET